MNKTTNNYVVVTKTKIVGYCVEKRDAEALKEKGRSRAIFDIKRGEMVNTVNRYRDWETDRKSTRLNSSHSAKSRMPSSA